MHFDPKAVPAEAEAFFRRAIEIVGWSSWKKRIESIDQQIQANSYLKEFFERRYALELEVGRLQTRRRRTGRRLSFTNSYEEIVALSFIAMVARIYPRLSPTGKRRFEGMLRDGLQAEYGLTSVQHELGSAAYLMGRGFDVRFSDIEEGGGFDLLARMEDVEFEVECKTVSGDLGRQIHERRMYQLGARLFPTMSRTLDSLDGGLCIHVNLSGRLSGRTGLQNQIVEGVKQTLSGHGCRVVCSEFEIRSYSFCLSASPFFTDRPGLLGESDVRQYFEEKFGIKNKNMLMMFRPKVGALVLVLESARRDRVMEGLFRQLKHTPNTSERLN